MTKKKAVHCRIFKAKENVFFFDMWNSRLVFTWCQRVVFVFLENSMQINKHAKQSEWVSEWKGKESWRILRFRYICCCWRSSSSCCHESREGERFFLGSGRERLIPAFIDFAWVDQHYRFVVGEGVEKGIFFSYFLVGFGDLPAFLGSFLRLETDCIYKIRTRDTIFIYKIFG